MNSSLTLLREIIEGVLEETLNERGMKGACWKGYEAYGMKPGKGGKMVPNCVPKKNKRKKRKKS